MFKKAFTLSEVLITLAVIGIVAAMAIPSVMVSTNQLEYKTGLKKAVYILNQAIAMNVATTGKTPGNSGEDIFDYIQKNMKVMRSTTALPLNTENKAFYTTDGMRFETYFRGTHGKTFKGVEGGPTITTNNIQCGPRGVRGNSGSHPCLLMVDINGDKKPNPANSSSSAWKNYKYSSGDKLTDVFAILITDKEAVPYGYNAQKAMYSK